MNYYRKRGYTDAWIEARLKGILNRNKLTDAWKESGIKEDYEYAILTNEIYKSWSGMSASDYKAFKGLRKESLRDNVDDIELILTELGESATKRLVKKKNPKGLNENIKVARIGGNVANVAKITLEKDLEESVITNSNNLNYKYKDENKLIK